MPSPSDYCHPLSQNKPLVTPRRACGAKDKSCRWVVFHTRPIWGKWERAVRRSRLGHASEWQGDGIPSSRFWAAERKTTYRAQLLWPTAPSGWLGNQTPGSPSVLGGKPSLCPVGMLVSAPDRAGCQSLAGTLRRQSLQAESAERGTQPCLASPGVRVLHRGVQRQRLN